jgi:transcriptional regulator with XRE-family HTH domain
VKNSKEVRSFGERFRELRKAANLSQEQLSWEADIGLRTIQRIESGQNAASIDLIYSIARALKINPIEFFKDSEK